MSGRFQYPIHDAAPLRLLSGLHHLVLEGDAVDLRRFYPTVGGEPGAGLQDCVRETVKQHASSLDKALSRPVQTNEVGRSIVHMALCHWLGRLHHSEVDFLEVGSSAGLNLNFHHYGADTGLQVMGRGDSTVVFGPDWFDVAPPPGGTAVSPVRLIGSDPFPIDVTTEDGASRVLSFVWPDHTERFERLRAAINIARKHPPTVQRASADAAISRAASSPLQRPTIVFHSITWQYMGKETQTSFVAELHRTGQTAAMHAPLIWARMEPAGPVADLRATIWTGKKTPEEYVLGTIGYHGRGMRWNEPSI